jgi:ABC-2 type transport system ATP-binding protein
MDPMGADDAIVAEQVTKRYGTARGAEDLTFAVRTGEVFGFLGPNGAGKTTTIRTALDLLRPTSGRFSVFGLDPRSDGPAIRARVGYLPGDLALWQRMTGVDYLEAFGSFRGGVDPARIRALADRLSLDLTRRIRALSHGNKQKIGLVLAFAHDPELLILDEPTQGLDPLIQQEFYALIDETRGRGATVFLSSHVLPEVERVCDRVAIIREGRLIRVAEVDELKAAALRRVRVGFAEPVPAATFASLPGVQEVSAQGSSLSLTVRGELDAIVKEAARHRVVDLTSQEPSLEELFLAIYRDGRREP